LGAGGRPFKSARPDHLLLADRCRARAAVLDSALAT